MNYRRGDERDARPRMSAALSRVRRGLFRFTSTQYLSVSSRSHDRALVSLERDILFAAEKFTAVVSFFLFLFFFFLFFMPCVIERQHLQKFRGILDKQSEPYSFLAKLAKSSKSCSVALPHVAN